MSSSVSSTRVIGQRGKLAGYLALTKPRISVMVLITVAVAALISANNMVSIWPAIHAIIGTFFIAASGSALNQYIERYSDFVMRRTAGRPLPAQKLSAKEVAVFGAVTFGSGIVYLATNVNLLAAAVGLLTWVIYVWIYTPLKTVTWLNTVVGAVAGALPILIGASAVQHWLAPVAWAFFGVLFLWQFPHFMAIAWKYQHEYAEGKLKMLTVTDPSGKAAGLCSVVTAVLLLPASLLPMLWMQSQLALFAVIASSLGVAYLYFSVRFAISRDNRTAKHLLRVSLLYLPAYMVLLVIGCLN